MSYLKKKWYKPEKLSTKIIFVAVLLLIIRLLSNIPVPFIDKTYLSLLFSNNSAFALLNTFSGGAFTDMTIMALGVTPYITASIILQLLCITFPKLKAIQQDTMYGQNKWKIITIFTGIGLGLIQSIGMALTLGKGGLFSVYNFGSVSLICFLWVLGGTITILIGEYISKFCVGNGISLILASNIIAALPRDIISFWNIYIQKKSVVDIIIASAVFIAVVFALIAFTAVLSGAGKDIPVVYPTSRQTTYKNNTHIPMKLNAAGVMPIIFTSTLFSIPMMFNPYDNKNTIITAIYDICSAMYRCNVTSIYWYIGITLSLALVILFAYFYVSITINTTEIANRIRKKGGCIPGIRPGKPTEDYLHNKMKYMTFIGAIILFALTQIPVLVTSFTKINSLTIGGTSIIIVVGVIMETALAIKSEHMMHSYNKKGSASIFGANSVTTMQA